MSQRPLLPPLSFLPPVSFNLSQRAFENAVQTTDALFVAENKEKIAAS